MSRRPNVLGIAIISALYCGSLIYWQWDALFSDVEAEQMMALYAVTVSLPYVGFVIWGTSTDLPDNVK